jgi:Rrf2 family transcriptional regulator, iron-sulfur cluster assembly transcription factor
MLSNTCKYAIRAVIYLAVHEKKEQKIGIKQISHDLKIPSPFLGKILQILTKNKLLNSTKGPNGGFCLGRSAGKISLLDIVDIIDGMDFFNNCLVGMKVCINDKKMKEKCPFHESLDPIRDNLRTKFKTLTIGAFKKGLINVEAFINL